MFAELWGGGPYLHLHVGRRRNLNLRAPNYANDKRFTRLMMGKFMQDKVQNEKRFRSAISRFDEGTAKTREKIERKRGELDYEHKVGKKKCNKCGREQTYSEWKDKVCSLVNAIVMATSLAVC